ncbi:MAG: type II toxin-antitoxin system HicA family toxin [Methanospirillum sp.]|uniref:type II toxin-antitoxin system HicA family toxin n=1 Tax=Methanospirillum sp. TaxID=45200 RepID=UPI002370FF93|nr:type II toxin-antitoxin system HicA family toxin [Methanospirillum sp.]MDD1728604.1 type II toxin-antitoxin system HicA family toxin [Methanospirillum sp.]
MKVPRNISGSDLIGYLLSNGFQQVRQTGSHVRLECNIDGEHYGITVPLHDPLKTGTLSHIVKEIAEKTGRDWVSIMEEI